MTTPEDSPSAIELSRIGWVGPLAIVSSVGAVLIVRIIAVAVLRPDPTFTPLGWTFPIVDTAILTTGAVLIFGAMAGAAATPIRTFRRTAAVVLVLSLIPPIAAAFWTIVGRKLGEHVCSSTDASRGVGRLCDDAHKVNGSARAQGLRN